MRKVSEYIDEWGLLDKLVYVDGGDTCQREGMFFSLAAMGAALSSVTWERGNRYAFVMKKLHVAPGVFIRHSNTEYSASDWDRMSRDQLQPMIIAAGYWSEEELNLITKGHLKRGFLFCNNVRRNGATKGNHGQNVQDEKRNYDWKLPDVTGPEVWANFIRSHKSWWAYPLLLLFDLEILFGAIKWRFFPEHNIAMNQTLSMMQGWDRMRTPWTWLAVKIMPIEKLVVLIEDHFNDFHEDRDMQFFGPMFRDAWGNIK